MFHCCILFVNSYLEVCSRTDDVCLPDGSGYVPLVPPLFGRIDVHAPQLPVVAVAWVLVALHLKRVVLDVIDGGQNNPLVVLFDSGQNRLGPEKNVNTSTLTHLTETTRQTAQSFCSPSPTSVSYKVPHVVATLLQIPFDSAQCSSGGHVSIYAEWTGLCTYAKVHTALENE